VDENLVALALVVAVAGVGAGVLAGLLGVGGGILLVPVLEYAYGVAGVEPGLRMHLAVGTSLASIIPTAIASARAHRRRGAVDPALALRWSPAIAVGAALGALLASNLRGSVLSAVFGIVALVVAVRMLWGSGREPPVRDADPTRLRWLPVPASIGCISALMGIGGGTLSVPVMTSLGLPVHRAVGTSAWFGLWIAAPGALGFALLGQDVPGLPAGSVGYVNLVAMAILLPATVLAAPVGATLAHRLTRPQLSAAFGIFLLLTSTRMLYRAIVA